MPPLQHRSPFGTSTRTASASDHRLGARWDGTQTHFAVSAPEATAVWLCIIGDDWATGRPNETRLAMTWVDGGTWTLSTDAARPGTRYGFRAEGPWDPGIGHRFNVDKLLIDPYARAITGEFVADAHTLDFAIGRGATGGAAGQQRSHLDSLGHVPLSVVTADASHIGRPPRPRRPWRDTVILETHVRGLTMRHPGVPLELRGTYAGLAHPSVVEYIADLGVTAVELMPVHQFVHEPRLQQAGLANFWGYNTLGFFAPHAAYAASGTVGQQVQEFRAMVDTYHAAGLEVILDVVYNHTAEQDETGPSLSWRGLCNRDFYRLAESGDYVNWTGCGNTVDVRSPRALAMILDSLRYWADDMGVDGFRFDLAPTLARGPVDFEARGAFFNAVFQDPILREVKLIAEPWDVGPNGYQVGAFPFPWSEWNDRFRDTVRDFWRGSCGTSLPLALALSGSPDRFGGHGRTVRTSINYVTAHDGFTLRDAVSYEHKHNMANGEGNRDGHGDNRTWNCGVEGDSAATPEIDALRRRQAANMLATTMLAAGVPMLLAGDERGRTQQGNNNAYCLDDPCTWTDWSSGPWEELTEVVRRLGRIRAEFACLRPTAFGPHPGEEPTTVPEVTWYGPQGSRIAGEDWSHTDGRILAMLVDCHGCAEATFPRREPETVVDHDSVVVWCNSLPDEVSVVRPATTTDAHLQVLLNTADLGDTHWIAPDAPIVVAAHSTLVARVCR